MSTPNCTCLDEQAFNQTIHQSPAEDATTQNRKKIMTHLSSPEFWLIAAHLTIFTLISIASRIKYSSFSAWTYPHLTDRVVKACAVVLLFSLGGLVILENIWIYETLRPFVAVFWAERPGADVESVSVWFEWLATGWMVGTFVLVCTVWALGVQFVHYEVVKGVIGFDISRTSADAVDLLEAKSD